MQSTQIIAYVSFIFSAVEYIMGQKHSQSIFTILMLPTKQFDKTPSKGTSLFPLDYNGMHIPQWAVCKLREHVKFMQRGVTSNIPICKLR